MSCIPLYFQVTKLNLSEQVWEAVCYEKVGSLSQSSQSIARIKAERLLERGIRTLTGNQEVFLSLIISASLVLSSLSSSSNSLPLLCSQGRSLICAPQLSSLSLFDSFFSTTFYSKYKYCVMIVSTQATLPGLVSLEGGSEQNYIVPNGCEGLLL